MAKNNIKLQFSIRSTPGGGRRVYLTDLDTKEEVFFSWNVFYDSFYKARRFPFNNLSLPKVTQYYSPAFDYKDQSHAFLFKSMNPKPFSYQNELGDKVTGFLPWSHCWILVNLEKQTFVEFILFFSETQIKSEFLHDFFIPNVDSEHLAVSELLSDIVGIDTPVYRYPHLQTEPFLPRQFGERCQTYWEDMMSVYVEHCDISAVLSEDINDLGENFMTHVTNFDSPISIEMFENFKFNPENSSVSFYDMLCDLFIRHCKKTLEPELEMEYADELF